MILGIDIGNSNVVIGYINGKEITRVSRFETDALMSAETFCDKLKDFGAADIDGAVISSVVRPLTETAAKAARLLTGAEPLIVGPALKTGLIFAIESPEKLGCDRISDCAAAVKLYPLPAVIADFGTATTLSVVGRDGRFLGGSISPGIKMSAAALSQGTNQLKPVEIEAPGGCIGRNTDECIKSGIIIGAAAMLDGMAGRIEKSLGENITVIATGGLSRLVVPYCERNVVLDENLLLKGLAVIYEMNN